MDCEDKVATEFSLLGLFLAKEGGGGDDGVQ